MLSSHDCPLKEFTCDTCAYHGSCAPSRAEKNTEEIISLLKQVLSELKRRR
jgi:hypothetical protein